MITQQAASHKPTHVRQKNDNLIKVSIDHAFQSKLMSNEIDG